MRARRRWPLAALAAILILGSGAAGAFVVVAPAKKPPVPPRPRPLVWPFSTIQLGVTDGQGDAAALRASAPFTLRYHYLSGGVNTGADWQRWATGKGAFVTDYITESAANDLIPVLSYYELRQSLPGSKIANETTADLTNLTNRRTMRAYFTNVTRLMTLIGAQSPTPVVLQVEPDLWGYIQQHTGNAAGDQPAAVQSTGLPQLATLPNTAAGLAQAFVRLRNEYAPNVILAYQLSVFGTDKDLHTSALTGTEVDGIAAESAAFYRSLHARFNLMFAEFTNSDAGYQEDVLHLPDPLWAPADYARQVRYLGDIYRRLTLPTILWQIPVGNSVYRTDDNTRGHWQDNRVQWLLGPDERAHLEAYARAGVIGLLFGSGVAGGTCACDADHDGITNPKPIDGNTKRSTSPDDDGGYLVARTQYYYSHAQVLLTPAVTKRVQALGRRQNRSRHPRLFRSASGRRRR